MSVVEQLMCQDERPVMRQRALHFLMRSPCGDRERVEILPRLVAIRLAEIPRKRTRAGVRRVPVTIARTWAEAA
jgi:hypothetical protein